MKLIQPSPIVRSIKSEISNFTCVDIGCGYNGIDKPLHDFDEKLVAYGFDSNITECKRLADLNTNSNIHYIAGFVKLDPAHPFAIARKNREYWTHNPWSHLAVSRTVQSFRAETLTNQELNNYNLWSSVKDTTVPQDIYLEHYLPSKGINNIDLCKIDIDGPDFEVLHSLESYFSQKKILSLVMEVNFFGSQSEYDHTFHNVDRYLRQYGFDLYGLTVNKYSAKSLPSPYNFSGPGENISGRPYQGDALYILDPFQSAPDRENLLKLVAICSLFNLPDWSAEIIQTYGSRNLHVYEKERLLKILTNQIQKGRNTFPDYNSYIKAFEENNQYFYSGAVKNISPELQRLRDEIAELKSSTSWRLMKPLRIISDILKKFVN